jgi:hypothetical protein
MITMGVAELIAAEKARLKEREKEDEGLSTDPSDTAPSILTPTDDEEGESHPDEERESHSDEYTHNPDDGKMCIHAPKKLYVRMELKRKNGKRRQSFVAIYTTGDLKDGICTHQ